VWYYPGGAPIPRRRVAGDGCVRLAQEDRE